MVRIVTLVNSASAPKGARVAANAPTTTIQARASPFSGSDEHFRAYSMSMVSKGQWLGLGIVNKLVEYIKAGGDRATMFLSAEDSGRAINRVRSIQSTAQLRRQGTAALIIRDWIDRP